MTRTSVIARVARSSVVLLLAGGCAGPTSTPTPTPTESAAVEPTPPPRRAAEIRSGLVVERLRVREASVELDAAITSIPEVAPPPPGFERWRREGVVLKVVDEDGLAALEATLGSAVIASRTWHGEATGWRSAARRRLSRGAVMLQDGRARPVEDRILTLSVRGWSIPLVDGAGLQVELVPHLSTTTIDPLATLIPPGEIRGDPLAPMVERTLGVDQILLVATVPDRRRRETTPSTTSDSESEITATEGDGASPPPPATSATEARPIGPGPVAVMPPTIGGWLVDDPVAGERGILLIRGRPHPAMSIPGTGTELPSRTPSSP